MAILKLKPYCRDTVWGGSRLKTEYGIQYDGPNLAEAWVLSCHPQGASTIENGPFAGKTLPEYLAAQGPGALGTACAAFAAFPVLIKLIDTQGDSSIQVHPSDAYARAHEGQYGKTEMWYILEADPGAFAYYGFEREIPREEFARRIADDTLPAVLHRQPLKKGESYFIPAGTLHAVSRGVVFAEVQQSSNVTYRIYDYGRRGADGKRRALHVEQALDVTRRGPADRTADFGGHLCACPSFAVDLCAGGCAGVCGAESFVSLLVFEGAGTLENAGERMPVKKGDSLFLPAGSGAYRAAGACRFLRTTVDGGQAAR